MCQRLSPVLQIHCHVWVPSQPSEVDVIISQYYIQCEDKTEASDSLIPSLFTSALSCSSLWTLDWWDTDDKTPGVFPACISFYAGRKLGRTEAGCTSTDGGLWAARKQKSSVKVVNTRQLSPASLQLSHQAWRIRFQHVLLECCKASIIHSLPLG